MRTSLLALLLTFGSLTLHGQAPDCQFTATFTGATASPALNNRTSAGATPCVKWRVAYYSDGLTAPLSIALEGANDFNNAPDTWAAIAQANVYEGTNPLTDANQSTAAMTAYYPWIRLNVTTFTPTGGAPHQIVARVYGYKGTSPGSASTGGGIVACSTTPPTTGTAGETCYTTTNLVYLCPASGPCSVLGDWTLIGPGSGFVNPMNALGDTIYGGAAGAPQTLPGNTSTLQKVLSQTGDGTNSAPPSWQPPQTSGTLTYYLQSTDSALTNPSAIVTTDKQMLTPPQAAKTNIDIAHNASGDVILQTFATDPGFPGITFIPFGAYIWHIHAERLSGNRAVTLYAVFREVTATGTNVGTIGTQTESSLALNGVEQEFPLAMADGNPYFLALATSRIVIDCHAVFTGGSNNTTVRMFVGGTADSHISLPSNTVDATSFVPYSGATNDVALGTHGITGLPFTGDSGLGGTTGLVPAPTAGDAALGKYLSAGGGYAIPPGTGGAANYQTVNQAGTPLTQRPTLNFAGAGVSCVDNSGATRTDCTITAGSAGGMVLLEEHTASNSATLDFTTWYSASYDQYQVEIVSLQPASSTTMSIRLSTNGGSNYDAGANYGHALTAVTGNSTGGSNGATNDTQIWLRDSNADTSGDYPVDGRYVMYDPAGSSYKVWVGQFNSGGASDTEPVLISVSSIYRSTSAVNAFQIKASSGNLASGTVRVYGLAK